MLLGAHSRVESIGELNAFERRLNESKASEYRCSCGEFFSECCYWQKILGKLTLLPVIGCKGVNHDEKLEFSRENKALFEAILAYTGKTVICDASKNFNRLNKILFDDVFDPFIIYLVRDPRAVGYSMYRKGLRIDESHRKKYQYLQGVKRWTHFQKTALSKLNKTHTPYITIRYEDLVMQPNRWLGLILDLLGLELEQGQLKLAGQDIHYVEGNRLRFEKLLVLSEDKAYVEALSGDDWKLGTLLAEPYLTKFGYSKERW